MKQTAFILVLSILTMQGFAQPTADYLGIGFGFGTPVGAFAATNSDNYDKAGFANTGGTFNINYVHKFNEWFGLAASTFSASNGVKTGRLLDVSGENYVDVRSNSNASSLLVGGYFKQSDFPIYAKAMIGFGAVQTAGMRFYDNSGEVTFEQSDPTFGFAYSVGVGAFFPIAYRWALTASVDFVSIIAKPSVTVIDNGNVYQGPTFSYNQNFINGQVGIGYMFGPRYHRRVVKRPVQESRRGQY